MNTDVENVVLSKFDTCISKIEKKDYICWLQSAPKLTTYRINSICQDVNHFIECIQEFLEKQSHINKWDTIPRVYQLFPDVIAVECWTLSGRNGKLFEDNVPNTIIDVSCGSSVLRGANVFAPAVMGLPPDISFNQEVNIYADISGLCRRGLKTEFVEGKTVLVGRGRLKMLRNELFGDNLKPRGIAIETLMPASRVPVIDSQILPQGCSLLQNLPSIICSKVLDPRPGETVLDMCAAPGNKTTHLAEIMKNQGIIIAIDKNEKKVNQINARCQELSVKCVHSFVYDSTKAVIDDGDPTLQNVNNDILDGPKFRPESFDRILLDVPCSALGQRPLLSNKMTVKVLKSYVPLQRKLFHSASRLLKVNGRLVYSTCTIAPEECEGMVAWALKTFPYLCLIPAEPLFGGPGWPGHGLNDDQRSMVQRFGPEKDELRKVDEIYNDTIGFFLACFTKR